MSLNADELSAIGSCVSAAAATGGLVGLGFYVAYTKRMMMASEQTLRATIEPLLVPEISTVISNDILLDISNEGNGHSLQTCYWSTLDSKSINRFPTYIEPVQGLGADLLGIIRANSQNARQLRFMKPAVGHKLLIVIECNDLANTSHQLQILYERTSQIDWIWDIFRARRERLGR